MCASSADATFVPVFVRTCLLSLGVAVIYGRSSPIRSPICSRASQGRLKYVMTLVFVIPLMMSYIIKIYAIRAMLGSNGFLNRILLFLGVIDQPLTFLIFNLYAVLLTLAVILLPFAILPIFIALERIPRNILDASADLGASSWQTFRGVIWPLSLQGTIVGATFTFVLALGDFVTPQMVGGQSGFTFGRIIYSQFGFAFNWPFGAALSVILLVVVLAVIVWTARSSGRGYQLMIRPARSSRPRSFSSPASSSCSSTARFSSRSSSRSSGSRTTRCSGIASRSMPTCR